VVVTQRLRRRGLRRNRIPWVAAARQPRAILWNPFGILSLGKADVALPKGTVPFSSNENRDSPPLILSPVLSDQFALNGQADEFGNRIDFHLGEDFVSAAFDGADAHVQ
jgi:hypothetical protein